MPRRKPLRKNRFRRNRTEIRTAGAWTSELLEDRTLLSAAGGTDAAVPSELSDTHAPTSPPSDGILVGIRSVSQAATIGLTSAGATGWEPVFEQIRGLGLEYAQAASAGAAAPADGLLTTRWTVPDGRTTESFLAELRALESVEFAEPDWMVSIDLTPNDPRLSELWGLHNTGQTGGKVDADIDAIEAWDRSVGSFQTVVGVVDTGVDYTHRDLYLNVWVNQSEIPAGTGAVDVDGDGLISLRDLNHATNAGVVTDTNSNGYIDGGDLLTYWSDGSDADGNGFTDDLIGWDFANNDNDPYDDHDHGTHVSGTIGALGNNSVGVVGVNWNVQIMGLKFLSASGGGTTSGAIGALQYARLMGADLTNNSWGGGGFSTPLKNEIDLHGAADMLVIAAAGNDGSNTDVSPHYPSAYNSANLISVAASTHSDQLAGFSNFGAVSVDLAAPGQGILSTLRGNRYGSFNGTSMASPHVAGVAALLKSAEPRASYQEIRDAILSSVDLVGAFASTTASGGRLNADRALENLIGSISAVELDRAVYGGNDNEVLVSVFDENANRSSSLTVTLTVRNAAGIVVDTETAAVSSSGTEEFTGSIAIDASGGAGTLQLVHGGTLQVTYTDTDPGGGSGSKTYSDQADVDFVGPAISSIAVDPTSARTLVTWSTDENATSEIRFGLSPDQLTESATDPTLKTSHSIALRGLQELTTYYYQLISVDAAGNASSDDQIRTFTTAERSTVLVVDDDEGNGLEGYFFSALGQSAYSYDVWDIEGFGRHPIADEMRGYDVVLWFTGSGFSGISEGLTVSEQQTLMQHLDRGGNVFLTGQNILTNELSPGFVADYLNIASYETDVSVFGTTGVAGDPVSDGMQLEIYTPIESGLNHGDTFIPDADSIGILDATWTGSSSGGFTGLRTEDPITDSRLVFFAFSFEGIVNGPNPNNQAAVMQRAVDWLRSGEGEPQPGILVSPRNGLVTGESGAQAQFTVSLRSQPTDDVIIPVATTDPTEGDLTISQLVFTPANWATPQTVVVTGIDDDDVDGDVGYLVSIGPASSLDSGYDGLDPADVSLINEDNDVAPLQLEFGVLSGLSTGTWLTVDLNDSYVSPVVIITPNYGAGVVPVTARVRNEGGSQFDLQLVRLDGGTGAVNDLSAHYMVIEEGVYSVAEHGVKLEAVRFDSTVTDRKGSWDAEARSYQNTYSSPVVVGQVQSANDPRWSQFWARGSSSGSVPSSSTLRVGKHVGEDSNPSRAAETIGYVVFESGLQSVNGIRWVAGVGADTVQGIDDAPPYSYSFSALDRPVVGIASSAGMDGNDGGRPVLYGENPLTTNRIYLAIDEDRFRDSERKHTTEQVAFVVFESAGPTPGVTVTPTGGTTEVSEAGQSDGYSVVLDSQPTSDVRIVLYPGAQLSVSPAVELLFTPEDWNQAQTVTVSAIDDDVAEGTHAGVISHAVESADPGYSGLSVPDVSVSITDNDTASVRVELSGTTTDVSEAGATDTYTLVLTSEPTADVTVLVGGDSQLTGAPNQIVFTPENWNIAQAVTVSAIDDDVAEGQHTGRLTHQVQSTDGFYNGLTVDAVTASITDNDVAGVEVVESQGATSVSEDGTSDTYSVVLTSRPTSPVTIRLSGGSQLTTTPAVLEFTPADWNVAQVVTVSAIDDAVAEGQHSGAIRHTVISDDAFYNALPVADVDVSIGDNDVAGIGVVESGGSTAVSEDGAMDTYSIVLRSQPVESVTIAIDTGLQLSGSVAELVFTPENWNVAQTVTLSAVDDRVVEGDHSGTVRHTATSLDRNYDGLAVSDVVVSIADNDFPAVLIVPTGESTSVTEGGANDQYGVVLQTAPASDVVVTLSVGGQLTTDVVELVFTSEDWDQAQTVTVSAIDDDVAEGTHAGVISHAVESTDPGYSGLSVPDVSLSITDNDTASVRVELSGTTTEVSEAGATDTYTLVLTSEPTADVTVLVGGDSQLTGAPNQLVFTPENWNVAQAVTVSAIDDDVAEGQHTGRLTHQIQSTDGFYNGLTVDAVTASITDNDVAGVDVVESEGATSVSEDGTSDTYSVVLTSRPASPVTIRLSGGGQLTTTPAVLEFTPDDWNVAQVVTVSAIDDAVAEGQHSGAIRHTVVSDDEFYNGLPVADLDVSIGDNDVAGIGLIESGGSTAVSEDGAMDTYSIVLRSQPVESVTIAIDTGLQLSGSVAELVFTPENWNVAQTVTLSAVDDRAIEGDHSGTVRHTATSLDGNYDGLAVSDVVASIADNDFPAVLIVPTGGSTSVTEGGANDQYGVVLESIPASDVVVTLSVGGQLTTDVLELVFTPADWDRAQTVTVSAIDDDVAEGTHGDLIRHSVSSLDPKYDGLGVDSVSVSIVDNDFAGVAIVESGESTDVTEGGASDSYQVILTSQPAGEVRLELSFGDQVETDPTVLVFDATNWDQAQTVAVHAVDDSVIEGLHQDVIATSVSSADPDYQGLEVNDVVVTVTDNDQPVSSSPKIETGEMFLATADGWTTVVLNETYNSMVVVVTLGYEGYSNSPMVPRVRNASGNQFEVKLQFANDGTYGVANIQYLVVEEGVYNQAEHGIKMEAVRFESTVTDRKNSWNGQQRKYQNSYASPVVIGQVMSANDPDWSVFWSRGNTKDNAPNSSLFVGKHVGEDPDQTRSTETIGYLIIESGSGTVEGLDFQAGVGADIVAGVSNGAPFNYSLGQFGTPDTAIVSQTAMDGNDGGWAILNGYFNTPNRLELAIDEDQMRDSERSHTTEQVAYLVFRRSGVTGSQLGTDSSQPGENLIGGTTEPALPAAAASPSIQQARQAFPFRTSPVFDPFNTAPDRRDENANRHQVVRPAAPVSSNPQSPSGLDLYFNGLDGGILDDLLSSGLL